MTKVWRAVLWVAAALLVIGLVLAGVGFLTGASVSRIVDMVFGGRAGLLAEIEAGKTWLLQAAETLRDTIVSIF